MTNTAALEIVETPAINIADVESAVEELAILLKKAAEIEKRARVLRAEVKEGLISRGLRKMTCGSGKTATLVESTSWRGDKAEADKLLDEVTIRRIFKPIHNLAVRIK
jgi:hypothetical protein